MNKIEYYQMEHDRLMEEILRLKSRLGEISPRSSAPEMRSELSPNRPHSPGYETCKQQVTFILHHTTLTRSIYGKFCAMCDYSLCIICNPLNSTSVEWIVRPILTAAGDSIAGPDRSVAFGARYI